MTNLATSPTMQRAFTESFADDPRIPEQQNLRDGADVHPVDKRDWELGQDEYEAQIKRQLGGAA